MNKTNLGIAIISVVIVLGGIFLFTRPSTSPSLSLSPDSYLYFWGNGCPHCKNVDDFLSTWEKKDKINLQKFEVWYDRNNAKLMQEKSKICNIKPSEMGVPLMITPDGKCLTGDTPIIDVFKSIK